jgi:hypothetical protein
VQAVFQRICSLEEFFRKAAWSFDIELNGKIKILNFKILSLAGQSRLTTAIKETRRNTRITSFDPGLRKRNTILERVSRHMRAI